MWNRVVYVGYRMEAFTGDSTVNLLKTFTFRNSICMYLDNDNSAEENKGLDEKITDDEGNSNAFNTHVCVVERADI